jgi:hypothetical protein
MFSSVHTSVVGIYHLFQLARPVGSLLIIMLVLWSIPRYGSSLDRLPIICLVDLSCHFYGVPLGCPPTILDSCQAVIAEERNCSHTPCPAVGEYDTCDFGPEH